MIKLKSRAPYTLGIPADLISAGCRNAIDVLNADPEHTSVTTYYNQESVKVALRAIHGNKCAYCEAADTDHAAPLQVDHYRPKKKIREQRAHTGYYWLAYEWSNLLLSCSSCNTRKSNHFPLWNGEDSRIHFSNDPDCTSDALRALNGIWLGREQRLLLHPELDNVERYLVFNFDGTVAAAADGMGYEGACSLASIKIYELNRDTLVLARSKKINRYWTRLIDILKDFEDNGAGPIAKRILYHDLRKYYRDMLQEQSPNEPFSRLGFYMFHHFHRFYLERLLSEYPDAALVADFYQLLVGKKP